MDGVATDWGRTASHDDAAVGAALRRGGDAGCGKAIRRRRRSELKRVSMVGWILALLMTTPSLLLGSEPTAVEVMQPMDIENFIWLSRVTYMGYYGDLAGGAISAVILTCNPNIVQTYAEARNLNVAADAGLKVRLLPNPADERSLFGDTLRVVLDATSLETLSNSFEWSDTT